MKVVVNLVVIIGMGMLSLTGCNDVNKGGESDLQTVQPSTRANPVTSVNPNGKYVCIYKDLFSGNSYTKTGNLISSAEKAARDLCAGRTGKSCVKVKCFDQQTYPSGQTGTGLETTYGTGWACLVTSHNMISTSSDTLATNTPRAFIKTGETYAKARDAAMKYCSETRALMKCQISRCYDQAIESPVVN